MELSPMFPGVNNSPSTYLSAAITATATTINVQDSTVLPAAPNVAVIGNAADAEVIYYGVKDGNILKSVTRGYGGTTKKAWGANTIIARNFTLHDYTTVCENITSLNTGKQDASAMKALSKKDKAVLTTDVSGILPIANGGTNASSASAARSNLGIGALGTKTKASLTTDVEGTLPIGNGGTGITANPSMAVNLESTSAVSVFATAPRPGVTGILPTSRGGTGTNKNPSMLVDLASGTAVNVYQESPRPGVTGVLPIPYGGTGASTKATALQSLGVVISATPISEGDALPAGSIYIYYE